MKRLTRIILIAVLAAATLFGAVACAGGSGKAGDKGLLLKKFEGDDFYTVYGYVKEDGDSSVLDLAKAADGKEIGRIKDGAFKDDNFLTEIIVPATVKTIDAGAFKNMRKLEKITLPFVGTSAKSDSYIGETKKDEGKATDVNRVFCSVFGTKEYEDGASVTANYGSSTATYYLPYTLREITVTPATGTSYEIPAYAFSGIAMVSRYNLSEGVTAIGAYAFENTGAEKISVTASLKNIYEYAFKGASKLKPINFTGVFLDKIGDHAFEGTVLPEIDVCVKEVGAYAFAGSSIAKATLRKTADGKIVIGAWAFGGCEDLTLISVEALRENVTLGVNALNGEQDNAEIVKWGK